MYYSDKNRDDLLIGGTIRRILIGEDKEGIIFVMDHGDEPLSYVYAETWGDCCSHTWIESIENAEMILGKRIVAVEDLDMPKPQWGSGEESMEGWGGDLTQFYGLAIRTEDGSRCVIEYRNSSNGYYGGDLVFSALPSTTAEKKIRKWTEVGA